MKLLERMESTDQSDLSVKGRILPVRFVPDPFTGEIMNVGVCFIDQDSRIHTRLLDSFHRLKCLYDDRVSEADMKHLLQIVAGAIPERLSTETESIASPTINIEFGVPTYAAGKSIDEVLERMYSDLVTLAVPFADEKRARMAGLDTAGVRKAVVTELRERLPVRFQSIIPENSTYSVEDTEGGHHMLDIPIRGKGMLGTILSACQTEYVVKQNMLEATIDLQIARQSFAEDRMGCFIMRDDSMDERRKRQIDNTIDKLDWKIRKQGIDLDVEFSPSTMADKIIEWSGIH